MGACSCRSSRAGRSAQPASGYARGVRERDSRKTRLRAQRRSLAMSQRVFPRTHEPSVTIARCLFAAAPGPTVRPPASASPHTSSADEAGQANFLRCRSRDIFQVERCTFFRAPDHGTHTRTRIFARVSRRFVERDGTNLHTQTKTTAPILVNRLGRLVGCFSK